MLPKPLRFSFVAFSIYDVHKDVLPSWFAEPLNIFQQIKHSCHITSNQDSWKQLMLQISLLPVGSDGLWKTF